MDPHETTPKTAARMSMTEQWSTLTLEDLYKDPEYPEKSGHIPHSDGETYTTIDRVELENGAVYFQKTVTEITDPTWYNRLLYWFMDRL